MKKMLFILAAMSLFLGACGAAAPTAEPTPALTGDDIQATAVSMAWTMAAQTIAAMPTETFTPVPPTETFTPEPTFTPAFTATPLFTATPFPTATKESTGISLCSGWEGQSVNLLIVNDTNATANISLYLTAGSNPRGYDDCYFVVPQLGKNQSASISGPYQGYYYIFAYMASNNKKWSVEGGFGTNNPDKHEIHLTDTGIKVIGP